MDHRRSEWNNSWNQSAWQQDAWYGSNDRGQWYAQPPPAYVNVHFDQPPAPKTGASHSYSQPGAQPRGVPFDQPPARRAPPPPPPAVHRLNVPEPPQAVWRLPQVDCSNAPWNHEDEAANRTRQADAPPRKKRKSPPQRREPTPAPVRVQTEEEDVIEIPKPKQRPTGVRVPPPKKTLAIMDEPTNDPAAQSSSGSSSAVVAMARPKAKSSPLALWEAAIRKQMKGLLDRDESGRALKRVIREFRAAEKFGTTYNYSKLSASQLECQACRFTAWCLREYDEFNELPPPDYEGYFHTCEELSEQT